MKAAVAKTSDTDGNLVGTEQVLHSYEVSDLNLPTSRSMRAGTSSIQPLAPPTPIES